MAARFAGAPGRCGALRRLFLTAFCETSSMANTSSAKKAVRQIERRTAVNRSRRSQMRTFLRKVEEALTAGDQAAADAALRVGRPAGDAGGAEGHRAQEHRLAESVAFDQAGEEPRRLSATRVTAGVIEARLRPGFFCVRTPASWSAQGQGRQHRCGALGPRAADGGQNLSFCVNALSGRAGRSIAVARVSDSAPQRLARCCKFTRVPMSQEAANRALLNQHLTLVKPVPGLVSRRMTP